MTYASLFTLTGLSVVVCHQYRSVFIYSFAVVTGYEVVGGGRVGRVVLGSVVVRKVVVVMADVVDVYLIVDVVGCEVVTSELFAGLVTSL